MRFTRMHGCGNDYVFVDARNDASLAQRFVADPSFAADIARRIADRHRGVGGDGLILLLPDQAADVRMLMFNADGSRGAMCGNGLRCLARLALEADPPDHCRPCDWSLLPPSLEAWAQGAAAPFPPRAREALWQAVAGSLWTSRVQPARIRVMTDVGVRAVYALLSEDGRALLTVDMGAASVQPAIEIPDLLRVGTSGAVIPVQVGNAHAVIPVPRVDVEDLPAIGSVVQAMPRFADGVNVHLVEQLARDRIRLRPWERGSGATQACGTGACAAVAALHHRGAVAASCAVVQPGGDVWVQMGDALLLTGPAEYICHGNWRGA